MFSCFKKRFVLSVLTVFLVTISLESASAQDPGRFARWFVNDAGAYVQSVGPYLPMFAAAGGALLLPTERFDATGRTEIQSRYNGTLEHYLDITNEFGGPLIIIPLVGIYEAALFSGNERFQDAAFTSLQSWVYNGVITAIFKQSFGRYRPESGSDPRNFKPFSGNSSFPSGHTSAIFAIVTPWVMYYPNVATYSLFILSASTGIARIAIDKHWPTDIIAGAALGIFTSRWLSRRHMSGSELPSTSLTPIVGPESAGVQFRLRFN